MPKDLSTIRAIYNSAYMNSGMDTGWPRPAISQLSQAEFCKLHGVSRSSVQKWEKENRENRSEMVEPVEFQNKTEKLNAHLEDKIFVKGAYSAKDLEIYAKINGLVVEKEELTHKIEFTADDHARIREDAERKVRDLEMGANGTGELYPQPPLLSDKLCEDSGRGQPEDD